MTAPSTPPAARRQLPVVTMKSSLRADGSREFVVPADVRGRFDRARNVVFGLLLVLYVALPWVTVGDHPAVFLDVKTRSFYLFGAVFNAQDGWMTVFLLTGAAFALVVATAILGRAWCGWACPQTVFLEAIYRRIERLIEGPRDKRVRRRAGPWTLDRLWRQSLVHALWIVVSLALAHVFLAYFVSVPQLFAFARQKPSEHIGAFLLVMGLAGVLYFDFAWFREQFCVVMCPYGRLQSVLLDGDSLVVGYDPARGEPRGKVSAKGAGDCVDCGRCVVVCPTGIDIRNGLQMDCLACTACIDACDEIMDRLHRPRGLIRYDSQNGLARLPKRFWRGRLLVYAALGVIGLAATGFAMNRRQSYDANVLRGAGAPYALENEQVQNAFLLRLVNKRSRPVTFDIAVRGDAAARVVLPLPQVVLAPLQSVDVPFFVMVPRREYRGEFPVQVTIAPAGERAGSLSVPFLGPTP